MFTENLSTSYWLKDFTVYVYGKLYHYKKLLDFTVNVFTEDLTTASKTTKQKTMVPMMGDPLLRHNFCRAVTYTGQL